MKALSALLVCAIAGGCSDKKKEAPPTTKVAAPTAASAPVKPAAVTPSNTLWDLAPTGTEAGIVFAKGALADLQSGLENLVTRAHALPAAKKLFAQVSPKLAVIGGAQNWSKASLEKLIDLNDEAALFWNQAGAMIVVTPRDQKTWQAFLDKLAPKAFVCTANGTRAICTVGKTAAGTQPPPGVFPWPNELAGGIQVFLDPNDSMVRTVRASVEFMRGGFTARFLAQGNIPPTFPQSVPTELTRGFADNPPVAALIFNIGPAYQMFAAQLEKQLGMPLTAFRGDLVLVSRFGTNAVELLVGLKQAAPVAELLKGCAAWPVPKEYATVQREGDTCVATLTEGGHRVVLAIEGNVLKGKYAGEGTPPTTKRWVSPFAKEIYAVPWTAMSFGTGLLFSARTTDLKWSGEQKGAIDKLLAHPEYGQLISIGTWMAARINEMGMGGRIAEDGIHGFFRVGTIAAYEDDITNALEPVFVELATGNLEALSKLSALVAKHPDSRFASDMAQPGAAILGAATVGVLAAVAVPSFMKYIKKSKTSEARMFVKAIYDGARMYHMEHGKLPESTTMTPPLQCCDRKGGCAPQPKLWKDPKWVALQFSVDQGHYYSYQYELAKDGQSFKAIAKGDLDCDGEYSTFTIEGRVENGEISTSPMLRRENELE
jgi:type II secretory pathway pseudopilin PulG